MTNSIITIKITKIKINTTIIASWTINTGIISRSISEQRKIVNQTTISHFAVNQKAIFNFSIIKYAAITFDRTLINRSTIQQMRFINQIIRSEKITTINLAKIIHRVIISINSRVFHTIIIIVTLIVINFASRLFIKLVSSFYISLKRKILNWIN
jgi:hypothetical protein